MTTCTCPPDPRGWWDCVDCPAHGYASQAEGDAESKSEQDAENAWLVAAEAPMWDDPRGD